MTSTAILKNKAWGKFSNYFARAWHGPKLMRDHVNMHRDGVEWNEVHTVEWNGLK